MTVQKKSFQKAQKSQKTLKLSEAIDPACQFERQLAWCWGGFRAEVEIRCY